MNFNVNFDTHRVVLCATCVYQHANLNRQTGWFDYTMFTISSFFSTFSQYFLPRLASLLPSKYIDLTLADQEAKFDWINWRERDTTKVWDKFSPFLASHGVFLFGTEAYSRVPLAPSSPALSPFLPTHDQDFVYHPRPCTYHTKYLYSSVHVFFAAISDEISDALSASTLPNGV